VFTTEQNAQEEEQESPLAVLSHTSLEEILAFVNVKDQVSFNCMAAVTVHSDLEPKKIKSVTVSTFSTSFCHEMMRLDAMIFVFWMLSFKPAFLTLLFHLHQEAL